MRVLLLVDAIPYRINLMAEEWYTVRCRTVVSLM
jgi:hypothetical protein